MALQRQEAGLSLSVNLTFSSTQIKDVYKRQGVGFAQRLAAGEPFLSGRAERNILATLDLVTLSLIHI